MTTLGLTVAIERITNRIERYESNTFSSSGSGLTHTEALAMTAWLIEQRVDVGGNVDGTTLDAALDAVRGRV